MPESQASPSIGAIYQFRRDIGLNGLDHEDPREKSCPFDVPAEPKPPREISRPFGPCDNGGSKYVALLPLRPVRQGARAVGSPAGTERSEAHASRGRGRLHGGRAGEFCPRQRGLVRKMCGLYLSESTVERTTENTGQRLAKLLAEKVSFGGKEVWAWQRDAQGQPLWICQCGRHGSAAAGRRRRPRRRRMAYVGTLYNPDSEHDEDRRPKHQVQYLAGFHDLPELGAQLRRQAGPDRWDEVPSSRSRCRTGATGWRISCRAHFPLAVRILDFYHVSEHLDGVGKGP